MEIEEKSKKKRKKLINENYYYRPKVKNLEKNFKKKQTQK